MPKWAPNRFPDLQMFIEMVGKLSLGCCCWAGREKSQKSNFVQSLEQNNTQTKLIMGWIIALCAFLNKKMEGILMERATMKNT